MFHVAVLFYSLFICVLAKQKSELISLDEETWPQLLEGEWLVKFYAPWCPACRALAPIWEGVAGWSKDLDVKVAEINVSENPGLSGRFLVTSLPTVFYVRNGEFRVYRGPRTENDIISFVDDGSWKEVEPIPWYLSPSAVHMSALGLFFKASMSIRDLHDKMTTDYGIPVWGSYAIFAVATIIFGLLLGLVIVFLCDFIIPNNPPPPSYVSTKLPPHGYRPGLPDDEDKDSDIVVDDLPKHEPQPTAASSEAEVLEQTKKTTSRSSEEEEGENNSEDENSFEELTHESGEENSEKARGGDVPRPKSARKRKLKATTD